MITGIVVALPEELRTLTTKKLAKGGVTQLNSQLLLAYAGAGADNASAAAALLIQQGASRLVSWGCAAALVHELAPGDLVLTNQCVTADNAMIEDNSAWLHAVETQLANKISVRRGRLAESLCIVSTVAEKQAVALATGAVALDMESVAVAKVATAHQLPFLVIRAIADPLSMNLPKAVSYALDKAGVISLAKLFSYLILHPGELSGLIKLGIHFYQAQKTLKRIATSTSLAIIYGDIPNSSVAASS